MQVVIDLLPGMHRYFGRLRKGGERHHERYHLIFGEPVWVGRAKPGYPLNRLKGPVCSESPGQSSTNAAAQPQELQLWIRQILYIQNFEVSHNAKVNGSCMYLTTYGRVPFREG